MSEETNIDLELWAMRLMGPEELDRFTNILEIIAQEEVWYGEWRARANLKPDAPLSEKERNQYFAHEFRREWATNQKLEMIGKYTHQVKAWSRLIDFSLAAIERLFEDGKLDQVSGLTDFWPVVYQQILHEHGHEISTGPGFRNVLILTVLKDQLTGLLPGFAESYFRKRGNPVLAQFLEKLAGMPR